MPRRRARDEKKTWRRDERRAVIWMTEEDYTRWKSILPLLGCRNSEEALMKLLDLYELAAKITGKRKIDDVIDAVKKLLGESVNLKVVEAKPL